MPRKKKLKKRELKPRLHIFCEGEKTEPNYFKDYIERFLPGTRLIEVKGTEKNTPVQLVEEAIKQKMDANNPNGDIFWVVYDRESERKYSDSLHAKALQKAERAKIQIAFSNVSFEVWLLLHFQETVPACDSATDFCGRRKFRECFPNYCKGDKPNFSEEMISCARANAVRVNQQTIAGADPSWKAPYKWNPYTNVYELLDSMDEHEKEYG